MEDRGPEIKLEEQYPLLKVDGGGDSPPSTQTAVPPGWGVQCSPSTWLTRRPEFISACWTTLILVGISFLVFYAMGMGTYRRQQFVFVNFNGSRPASNVFYHHLVQRGAQVPFLRYSEYFANMAAQYPYLQFNVFFLIEDPYSARGPRSNRLINKLIPCYSYSYKTDDNYLQALVEFQRRYQNVNVTVMPLSKFMAGTPMRFKWRSFPTSYLQFYARVFSVWEHGGVGIDLALHNANDDSLLARRKAVILKQHNDGIIPEAYVNALNKIDKEESTAVFSMFFEMVYHFLNETRSFINRTLAVSPPCVEPKSEPLVRVHRAKRDLYDFAIETTTIPDVSNSSVDIVNRSNISDLILDLPNSPFELMKTAFGLSPNTTEHIKNSTSAPQVVLFYDFQIVSDNIGPPYVVSEPLTTPELGPVAVSSDDSVKRSVSHLLAIDNEGTFVAASSRLHPFLGQLITAGYQRMAPKFAIQDALLSECSGFLRENVYCSNIYLL